MSARVSGRHENVRYRMAMSRVPATPTPAASVGVAMPARIGPSVTAVRERCGTPSDVRWRARGARHAHAGGFRRRGNAGQDRPERHGGEDEVRDHSEGQLADESWEGN